MKIVHLDAKQITGISVRTKNTDEMNPATAKIGALYHRFDEQVPVDYKNGARVYGVYFNYESDHTGEFSVLAGVDRVDPAHAEKLEKVTLPAATYMVFEGQGQMPQVVIDTWRTIWAFFSQPDAQYQRAYTTDFEFYKSQTEVAIHIAIAVPQAPTAAA